MISPEVLRRYSFFAGLNYDQLVTLAMMAEETDVEAGHRFFNEGDALDAFYLVIEGDVGVVFQVTSDEVQQSVAQQLTGAVQMSDVVISHVGPGEPFGWTAIAGDSGAVAGAVATVSGRVVAFDTGQLLTAFEEDPLLGYTMLRHVLRVAGQRMHDLRMECLVQSAN